MNHPSPRDDSASEPTEPTGEVAAGDPAAPRIPVRRVRPAAMTAYGLSFWATYLAATSLMTAVSLLFRYADFVNHLGGSEAQLGLVVGVGTIGALAMRAFQAVGIDRYGPRRVWLLSLLAIVVSCLAHMAIGSAHGPAIFAARIVFMSGLAGAFGSSITYTTLRSPPGRMAEMVGTLGSAGFVGQALGPTLGDWLFRLPQVTRADVDRMFLVAAALAALSLACAAVATRGEARPVRRRRPPIAWLLRRYHPGPVLIVAMAMGIGVGLPQTFLRAYAASLDIAGIKTFFLVYSATAFTVRILARKLPDRLGTRPSILIGLGWLVVGMLLFLVVTNEWLLIVPALAGGTAHAFLFPAVVAGGSSTFPDRYRGLGTTLVLAFFDVGNLVGQPLVGGIVEYSPDFGLPGYPTMFVTMAGALLLVAAVYALATTRRRRLPGQRS
jgi:MFS family permease